jgi:hypothetical protein
MGSPGFAVKAGGKHVLILTYPKNGFCGIISLPRVSALRERDGTIFKL